MPFDLYSACRHWEKYITKIWNKEESQGHKTSRPAGKCHESVNVLVWSGQGVSECMSVNNRIFGTESTLVAE